MSRLNPATNPRPRMPAGITVTGFGPVVGRFLRDEEVAGSTPATRTNTVPAGDKRRGDIAAAKEIRADN